VTVEPAASNPYVAVVGASQATASEMEIAEQVGSALAAAGAIVITGGRGGVMAAACRGARANNGINLGFLPGLDRRDANQWVTIAITTGLGELRNGLIVRAADALIAVGGSYGTLSEIALALNAKVPVVGLGTWAIDGVRAVDSPGDAVELALMLAREA
jgi:uncharacterized protein (TIGR00725 family)